MYVNGAWFTLYLSTGLSEELLTEAQASEVVRPGMVRDFEVINDMKEEIVLSMARREHALVWRRLEQMQAEDITVRGTISSANLGGAVVEVLNVRGFIPNSHLSATPIQDKDELIGTEIDVKFLEVDPEGERLMMSARRVESADTFTNFKIGDVVEGVVASVVAYGCFVEVPNGGAAGLLHISQISHDRVSNIEDLIAVGDRLKARPLLRRLPAHPATMSALKRAEHDLFRGHPTARVFIFGRAHSCTLFVSLLRCRHRGAGATCLGCMFVPGLDGVVSQGSAY